jgi:hypothetical protein
LTLTKHLATTGLAAVALAPVLSVGEIIVFAIGGVLIDVDHYLLYIVRRHDLSIAGMFRYFNDLQPIETSIPYVGLCVFHTVDFFLLLAALAYFYPLLGFLLAGCLFHFALDLFDLWRKGILFIRPFFLMEHFLRRRHSKYPWY